jgi:hypothetical protein
MSVRCHVIDVPSALPLSVCSALGRDKWRQTRIFNILGTVAVHSSTLFTSMVFNLLYLHKIKIFLGVREFIVLFVFHTHCLASVTLSPVD